jgi:tetratricopeptide (TPR) repeat protein
MEMNTPGHAALNDHLNSGRAVAFLGAGTSAPLYPLWNGLVVELVDAARSEMTEQAISTCRSLAASNPDSVIELVRRHLGQAAFRELLRQVFRARRDPVTGRTWTPAQELVARCAFAGVVTTNYDPGIVNARMAVRPLASGTGFASWTDDDALDRWRTGDVFAEDELPVLYAHGHHNQPDAIVLATTEYRRAYSGKLSAVLKRLTDTGHLAWIGFSFADQRIGAILREVGDGTGTRLYPGGVPRHVAVMPWELALHGGNGAESYDLQVVRDVMEIEYGCRAIFYPVFDGDHSALAALLEEFVQPQLPAADADPWERDLTHSSITSLAQQPHRVRSASASSDLVVRWAHGGVPVDHFTGREEELTRLDRWAADLEVRLIGVTAWGGAGKTALVTEWLHSQRQPRPVRGVFGWSFYEDPSAERWANELLTWAAETFGYNPGEVRRLSARILDLARQVPLLLVLDGLEGIQEVPAQQDFGRFLDGLLRAVLTGLCQRNHAGLVVLTSRFPFADLESFDGAAARMLDVPPFTPAEGAELLSRAGGDWFPEQERRSLVSAVDGHALAVGVLASTLYDRPPVSDMTGLRQELETAGRTDSRVARVLQFYAERLSASDRMLVAVVSLFSRPVSVETILALGNSHALDRSFAGWAPAQVEAVTRGPLAGLLTWHPDRSISAHPLVRDTFRPLALTGDTALLASDIALADLPARPVFSHDEALRVVEMIELLLEADQWAAADELHLSFMDRGTGWARIPAAKLGQRCALAFVGTPARRSYCREHLSDEHLARYINHAALFAMLAGDMTAGELFLKAALDYYQEQNKPQGRSLALQRLSGCLYYQGHAARAQEAAERAVELARTGASDRALRNAITTLGSALDLGGESVAADNCFIEADLTLQSIHGPESHIYSLGGTLWGDLLVRTGRITAARQLTEDNRAICRKNRWNHGTARCDRVLARCDLAEGDLRNAGYRLENAAATFREGDFLVELAMTLPDIAEHRRRAGDLSNAELLCNEAINLAGPRQLVPSHARALAIRARIRADRIINTNGTLLRDRARDDADHAMRLSTMIRRLPWQELDALEAHASIDAAEGRDQGWSQRASMLRERLNPDELLIDPLTVIRPNVEY